MKTADCPKCGTSLPLPSLDILSMMPKNCRGSLLPCPQCDEILIVRRDSDQWDFLNDEEQEMVKASSLDGIMKLAKEFADNPQAEEHIVPDHVVKGMKEIISTAVDQFDKQRDGSTDMSRLEEAIDEMLVRQGMTPRKRPVKKQDLSGVGIFIDENGNMTSEEGAQPPIKRPGDEEPQ